jgi:two-component system NtrC family sensor kinase/two-component system sensor histidine kinase AtoS
MNESISAEELNLLIEQTYKVEKEFTELKSSYAHLQDTIEKVVEFLPNAIWILDENNEIFLQNSKAKDLSELFNLLELENDDYEINFNSSSYLIKSSLYKDKKMLSCTDITEQKRKENLATMGQMAAHLSHEIRNPIGSISLLSSTLKKRVIEKNVPIVEEIQNAVYRIDRIIKATLMFSKGIEASKNEISWSRIRESLNTATKYYGYSKDITFKYPQDDFKIYGDKDLLEMLFSNFIVNAIDAIELDDEDDGLVEVVYEHDKKFHIFKIYDSGVDIEDKEQLFQAFKSTKVKGNGLGLVLSQQIAEAHGGDVNLLDEKRKGFIIRLSYS